MENNSMLNLGDSWVILRLFLGYSAVNPDRISPLGG